MKFYLRGRLSNGSKSCLTRHVHSPICVSIGSFERPLVMVCVSGKIWLKFVNFIPFTTCRSYQFFSSFWFISFSLVFLLSYQTDILDLF